ncbi:MAG: YebC/PmpR family DNA-binding transcriptional regulator [Chlamydiales bacterium]|nr:YebC/PmpR family DNA-binding transcriptional regulator [Chlamydiales bacterium]
MAGHSKWANIKHRKEKADKQKGKLYSRATKEIISAVRQGGPDQKSNPKLKLAILKAKAVNLPNDNIERNIKKASSAEQGDYFELTYELYGYGGVGIIVDIMTDNKNRTSSDMRIATNKRGGTVAMPGSVAYNFDRKGIILVSKDNVDEETIFNIAIESGAEDFDPEGDCYTIITPPDLLYQVKEAIDAKGYITIESSLEMIPKVTVECDEESRKANEALIEWIENLEDVDAVFHNMMDVES